MFFTLLFINNSNYTVKSFSRIFYRNAINNGFLAIECKEIDDKLKTGDEIIIDLDQGCFTKNEDKYNFSPLYYKHNVYLVSLIWSLLTTIDILANI